MPLGLQRQDLGKHLLLVFPFFNVFSENEKKADNLFAEMGEAAEKIAPSRLLPALIITPTRELALQVHIDSLVVSFCLGLK